MPSQREHYHFVTGRLAEHALKSIVAPLAGEVDFDYSVQVLPITVAALMSPPWIAKRLEVPQHTTQVMIPGYCEGDLSSLESASPCPVLVGPRDLRQLPAFFQRPAPPTNYGEYDIEIIAEINNCPRIPLQEILSIAADYAGSGANVIDVGCEPGDPWMDVGEVVRALRDEGHRVSIDSLNPIEIALAVASGAELVLSVNSTNREAAIDWGVEVIATPDVPANLEGLDDTIDFLAKHGTRLRIDPILEPIAFGFANSLGRYLGVRHRYPDAELMMGVGNLTELTEVDSAGVNTLLLGFCQEQNIHSILTTEVINWARSSVRECDLARRLTHHAVSQRVLPKHVDSRLVMLRDSEIVESSPQELEELAASIRDNNYRVFASEGEVHLVGNGIHLHDADPFMVMEQLRQTQSKNKESNKITAGHAFYLGYEMCKALTALTLGKTYRQDEPLDWGFATRSENRHYLRPARNSTSESEGDSH
ncbi:DUF6513 domain-containing protein [Adhaeretor mobilis]|uniref:Pterin-binding domain-containing protein n=1 Tax=Adhaeretor mobilis TaxID=1930276 RepID=A0A517MWZ5_9BACT|nr:DUF6513 domain-containing protein [Adhaeretor mobilis]QDS99337.1 hypothetical protein HG15A2_26600 [Adhaeretor mobilis]